MMWPAHACRVGIKSLFIHLILDSMWGTSGTVLYTLPVRDHAIVKLLVNLKKHAQQDDTKDFRVKRMMFNIFCQKKQNKCFGLFLLG